MAMLTIGVARRLCPASRNTRYGGNPDALHFQGQVDGGNPGHLRFPGSCQRRGRGRGGRQEGVWGNTFNLSDCLGQAWVA